MPNDDIQKNNENTPPQEIVHHDPASPENMLILGRVMLPDAFHNPAIGQPDGDYLLSEAFRLRTLSVKTTGLLNLAILKRA